WSETDPATDGARIGVLAYRRQLRQERSSGDQADALACHQSPRRFAQRGHAADERGDVLFDLRQLQAQRMFSLLEMYSAWAAGGAQLVAQCGERLHQLIACSRETAQR